MLKTLKRIALMAAIGFAGIWLLVRWKGSAVPEGLGLKEGALADCPDSPNCVCSECEGSHKMEAVKFSGAADEAKAALKQVLARKGIPVIDEKGSYLHAVATTTIMRFNDDLEFVVDADAKTLRFRSASRLGKSDLGKNRSRLEEIFRELRKENAFK